MVKTYSTITLPIIPYHLRTMKHFTSSILAAVCAYAVSSTLAQSQKRSRPDRPQILQGDLKNGDLAPDFTLKDVTGKKSVTLSGLKGKPVVLVFGSCTCPPFVSTAESTGQLYASYKDRAHFYMIYVREAHPTDGWVIQGNKFQIKSPETDDDRRKIAQNFVEKIKVSMPVLVDGIDDKVEKTYACWPNRMYVLDAQGKIVDKGSAGPRGVSGSMRQAAEILDRLLAK